MSYGGGLSKTARNVELGLRSAIRKAQLPGAERKPVIGKALVRVGGGWGNERLTTTTGDVQAHGSCCLAHIWLEW